MVTYETLDGIADSINPGLAVVALAPVLATLARRRWRAGLGQALTFALLLATAYLLMWVDSVLSLFITYGLDYSTHTAVAVMLTCSLVVNLSRLYGLWLTILTGYLLLILYQGYHTLLDLLATLALVSPIVSGYLYRVKIARRNRT